MQETPLEDPEKPIEVASSESPADETVHITQIGAVLEKMIAALPEKLRAPLVLSTIDEMSPREVAATLGINEAAVRSRVFRARQIRREIDGDRAAAQVFLAERAADRSSFAPHPARHLDGGLVFGVDRVVNGFNEAHALNGTYRIAFDGPVTAAPSGFGLVAQSFELAAGDTSTVILDHDGLRITAFNVNHKLVGPAVGYRFDYKGRSIVVSGDTAPSSNLVQVAAGADVLVHEGMSPRLVGVLEEEARAAGRRGPAELFHNLQSYHTRPSDAADEASEAKVQALIFTHLIPPIPGGALEGPFLDDARNHFSGPLSIAEDGDLVSLPAGGGKLTRRNLL
jgi:hypothetical protein